MAALHSISAHHQRNIRDIEDFEAGKPRTRIIHQEKHDGFTYYRFNAADWPMRYARNGQIQVKFDVDTGDTYYIRTNDDSTEKVIKATKVSASIGHRMSRIAGVDRDNWNRKANERLAMI